LVVRYAGSPLLKGIFYDSNFEGIEYQTQSCSDITNANGEFTYFPGETVTFSIAGLVLGSGRAAKRMTPLNIVIDAEGDIKKIRIPKVTNIGRFIQGLARDGDIEKGILINDYVRNKVKQYRNKINFDIPEESFTSDTSVKALFSELGMPLPTPSQARNYLRRTAHGIRKLTDVKIPIRDGTYLLADIFMPIEKGKYPVIVSLGAYGKSFGVGCICNEEDAQDAEQAEDNYFDTGIATRAWKMTRIGENIPVMRQSINSEHFETANTLDWVPSGYIVMRIENRGVGKNPGMFEQFSLHEAEDYYDAIEWAGTQQWSNGNVGIMGSSYYAMDAYNVASLQPPHLKAMVPLDGDIDSYRDYIYTGGGLYNLFNYLVCNSCGEWQGIDWIKIALENPFDDPEIFGLKGKICISPDVNKITVPFWSEANIESPIHLRGSSEAYILAASKHKKFRLMSEPEGHGQMYIRPYLDEYQAFFDYWLKGKTSDIMEKPPVQLMIRTGGSGYYWLEENEWPVARTNYTKYYLDASPSMWTGDGKRKNLLQLGTTLPTEEFKTTYSTNVKLAPFSRDFFEPMLGGDLPWSYGVSFVSEPLLEDMVLAGYLKLVLWVSSTSNDMQIHASVRAMDEDNVQISYTVGSIMRSKLFPVAQGALKVSHRKLDHEKSTVYRPYHTHRKEDYQPLVPGEIVENQVEIWPTTALIKKGQRIVLDVQPAAGEGLSPVREMGDNYYQKGAFNTIYTGPRHLCYLQLPVIPTKK
jgi:predicted acyl esterase